MATAYSYGRVSHADQVDGDSVPAQEERTKRYFEYEQTKDGSKLQGVKWGGFDHDQRNISAYKKPFYKRPAGRRLIKKLKPGDHIIFDKVDRIWRSNEDFVDLMRFFKQRQVTVHFVSLSGCSIVMDTPMGDFVLGLMVLLAQLEPARTSERLRACFAHRRLNGQYAGPSHRPPMGTRLISRYVYRNGKRVRDRKLEWDGEQLGVMRQILQWRNDGRLVWWIADQLEKMQADKNHCMFMPKRVDRAWTMRRVNKILVRQGWLSAFGDALPDPNTLYFAELDRQYQEQVWAVKGDEHRQRALKMWARRKAAGYLDEDAA